MSRKRTTWDMFYTLLLMKVNIGITFCQYKFSSHFVSNRILNVYDFRDILGITFFNKITYFCMNY